MTTATDVPADALAVAIGRIDAAMSSTFTGRDLLSAGELGDLLLDIRGELSAASNAGIVDAVARLDEAMRSMLTGRELVSVSEAANLFLDLRLDLSAIADS